MKNRKSACVVLASLAVVLCFAGCGAAKESSERETSHDIKAAAGGADPAILSAGGEVNAVLSATPQARLSTLDNPIAVTGRVVAVDNGPTITSSYLRPSDTAERTAVVSVDVDEVFAGADLVSGSGVVGVVLRRGLEPLDETGEPDRSRSMVRPLEDFSRALPVGTQVVVISTLGAPHAGEGEKLQMPQEALARGVPMVGGLHPQSFSLVLDDGQTVTGWSLTLNELLASLRET